MPLTSELDIFLALIVILCEAILFVFLYCIGRFYEIKFNDRTYFEAYLLPILIFLASLVLVPLAGLSLEYAALVSNVSALAVVLTFGAFLYMRMTGVQK